MAALRSGSSVVLELRLLPDQSQDSESDAGKAGTIGHHASDSLLPGDIVKHKSGGPEMVVNLIRHVLPTVEAAECTWFVGGILFSGTFALAALAKVDSEANVAGRD